MLLTCTVNRKNTFRSTSLTHAKQRASSFANRRCKEEDWVRVYVSSGKLSIGDRSYGEGSEIWMRRFNQISPAYKPGKWQI